jgi:hypothetical protein
VALTDIDRGVVLQAAAVQVLITSPPVLVIRALDPGPESLLTVLGVALGLLVAPAAAATFAAVRARRLPVQHALVANTLGWLVLGVFTIARLVVTSVDADLVATATILLLFALVEVGVGLTAAFVTTRLRREPAS